jgi:hypothetical protein
MFTLIQVGDLSLCFCFVVVKITITHKHCIILNCIRLKAFTAFELNKLFSGKKLCQLWINLHGLLLKKNLLRILNLLTCKLVSLFCMKGLVGHNDMVLH